MSLPRVLLSSWPSWKALLFPNIQSKNAAVSALLFLNSAEAWGSVAEEWNPLAELCGKTFSAWLLALLPDAELGGLFAESAHLSCEVPVRQSLLFLARGRARNALCISELCSQAEEFSVTPHLWGLPGKTHAYSDIRLWNGASSRREIPLLTINALCYRFINMSISTRPPASLPFCLSAYFSIHHVHFVSSQLDRLKARERETWRFSSSRSTDCESGILPVVQERNDPQLWWEMSGWMFCLLPG